ncbi:MAG: twin-arginine translocase TatA/TatE family subunit [Chloroflexi bacterium]|nr:twin-arginine translocase TatA/TatE family subunit [Chloroflexota bacterium]
MSIGSLGVGELLIIFVVALIVFGPQRLPEIAGQAGKAIRDFQRMYAGLTEEMNKVVSEAQEAVDENLTKPVNESLHGATPRSDYEQPPPVTYEETSDLPGGSVEPAEGFSSDVPDQPNQADINQIDPFSEYRVDLEDGSSNHKAEETSKG